MPLRLTVIKNQEYLGEAPASVDVGASPLTIGRDQNSGWSLPDPTRLLSSHHCTITPEGDGFRLSDASTNGTFLNGAAQRLPSDHFLIDGDQLTLGPYVVAVARVAGQGRKLPVADLPDAASASAAPPRMGDPAAIASRSLAQEAAASSMTIIRPAPRTPAPSVASPTVSAEPKALGSAAAVVPPEDGKLPRVRSEDVWSLPEPPTKAADGQTLVPPPPTPKVVPVSSDPVQGSDSSTPTAVRDVIAKRLGISSNDLPPSSDAVLVEDLTSLVVAFAGGLRRLMAERNRLLRDLSSRQLLAARRGEGASLALMATDADAVAALLMQAPTGAAAVVEEAFSSLAKQHVSTGAAALDAAQTLGELLSPERLSKVLPHGAQSERWLASYARLWNDMAPEWTQGFAEAFRLQFGAALDERSARDGGIPSGEKRS